MLSTCTAKKLVYVAQNRKYLEQAKQIQVEAITNTMTTAKLLNLRMTAPQLQMMTKLFMRVIMEPPKMRLIGLLVMILSYYDSLFRRKIKKYSIDTKGVSYHN